MIDSHMLDTTLIVLAAYAVAMAAIAISLIRTDRK